MDDKIIKGQRAKELRSQHSGKLLRIMTEVGLERVIVVHVLKSSGTWKREPKGVSLPRT